MSGFTVVDIAIPTRAPGTFHYHLPEGFKDKVVPGSIVSVPFRNRTTHGFVVGFPSQSEVSCERMKRVESVLVAEPLFDGAMLELARWVSDYYRHPLGEVLAVAVPRVSVERTAKPARKTNDALAARLEETGVKEPAPVLTEEQRFALERIFAPHLDRPVLLHGVTGSGKTEVYLQVLERVLASGKGAIILVPEIALTPQLVGRFSARFPGQVAVLHSDLTPKERFRQWERLRKGEAQVVVGARSAVFAPVKNLGLIVVDEEHEPTFKQEDSLRYHARDVAIVRARLCRAVVILGSATPSLESFANACSGKYEYVKLTKRVLNRNLPKTVFVDIKDKSNWLLGPQGPVPWLSQTLADRVRAVLAAGHQAMLFLNRLGYAHFLYCGDCAHTWRCRNCDVALTYYQRPRALKCHYCGWIKSPPDLCEVCHGSNVEPMGLGTERVETELSQIFPTARIERLDRGAITTRRELEAVLSRIQAKEIDIVIGTQMIAKGHDFPGVALVGVLMADSSLNLPDFRAAERTYQILTQVSGRAGRAEVPGEVIIQTWHPDHPVLVAAAENRTEEFLSREMESRRQLGFPPHQRLVMLRFQGKNALSVKSYAEAITGYLRRKAREGNNPLKCLGPAEAPLSRLNGFYRWQALLKGGSVRELKTAIGHAEAFAESQRSSVSMAIDVDPVMVL